MSSYDKVEDLFVELMTLTITDTIGKLRSGMADSKDIRNAITLLKDNGFTLRDVPLEREPDKLLEDLSTSLPTITAYGEIVDECENE